MIPTENSIKEAERHRSSAGVESVENVHLSLDSPASIELDRFWASSKNKERLQILSHDFFKQKANNEHDIVIILSEYVTDGEGIQDCIMLRASTITTQEQLNSSIEEADYHLIEHLKLQNVEL